MLVAAGDSNELNEPAPVPVALDDGVPVWLWLPVPVELDEPVPVALDDGVPVWLWLPVPVELGEPVPVALDDPVGVTLELAVCEGVWLALGVCDGVYEGVIEGARKHGRTLSTSSSDDSLASTALAMRMTRLCCPAFGRLTLKRAQPLRWYAPTLAMLMLVL
jgi:hypothetical protein